MPTLNDTTRRSFELPAYLDARLKALPPKTASAFIRAAIKDRVRALDSAIATVDALLHEREVLALLDMLNGHMFTPGISARDEIALSMADSPELPDKWDITTERWRLLARNLTETLAQAVRTLALNYWEGFTTYPQKASDAQKAP